MIEWRLHRGPARHTGRSGKTDASKVPHLRTCGNVYSDTLYVFVPVIAL